MKKTEWITEGIIRSIKRRDELYRKFKKTPTDSSNYEARKINLRTYNVIIKRSIFIAKKTFYHHIFQKDSSDIKNTWSIIKNLLHKKKKSNPLSKVFERVIYNQINNYFVSNNLYYECQYGFRKKHSTELAALNVVDSIIHRMELGHTPMTVYLDLSKAFDTLDHSILLNKPKY